jgi:hypothetical protein
VIPAIVLAGVAVIFLLVRQSRNREPTYGGKPLSRWFYQYCSANPRRGYAEAPRDDALFAIRQLGTSAVPYILEQYLNTNKDSSFQTNILANLGSLPRALGFQPYISIAERSDNAGYLLREIKPPMAMLLPTVTNGFANSNSLRYLESLWLLGCVGDGAEQAVPWLARALQQPAVKWSHNLAAQSLQWLGTNAKPAIPVMIAALPDPTCAPRLVGVLGDFGPDAKDAIPALETMMGRSNTTHQLLAAVALCQIDQNHTDAVAMLHVALRSGNSAIRIDAVRALEKFRTGGDVFVPELSLAARDGNNQLASAAVYTLRSIAPAAARSFLVEQLNDKAVNTRLFAAEQLLEMDANQPEALAMLLKGLDDPNPAWRLYTVESLGRVAPNKKEVRDALQKIATGDKDGNNTRTSARDALKRIERRDKK